MNLLKHLPRFRLAKQALLELEARERWTAEQIAVYQLERLNRLWASARQHTPYYRGLAQSLRLPAQFSSLSHFQSVCPILDKDVVRARQSEFLSDNADKGAWYHSGGSTGTPARYFRSHAAHRELLRGRYRSHAMWGVNLFDRWVFLWGHAASFAPGLPGRIERCKRPLSDWLRNRLRLCAYDLSAASLRSYLRRIEQFRPAAVYAYSTAALLLAQEAKAVGFHCPSLKMLVLTAEPVFPHIVKECEEAFGVPAIAEYGSAETSTLAFEWPDRTLRVREDMFIVETPRRDDGRYDIVVTILNSQSFPLIRYALGDITDRPLQRPESGFAYLSNVAGRHQDLIIAKSGEPIFAGWFEDILENDGGVRRYQVHQKVSGELLVQLEVKNPQTLIDTDRLTKIFSDPTGQEVTVEVIAELPPSRAGKHRWITSDLATETQRQYSSPNFSIDPMNQE